MDGSAHLASARQLSVAVLLLTALATNITLIHRQRAVDLRDARGAVAREVALTLPYTAHETIAKKVTQYLSGLRLWPVPFRATEWLFIHHLEVDQSAVPKKRSPRAKSKNTTAENQAVDDLLNLPFDHFERHALTRHIADIVRKSTERETLRVLDVGGGTDLALVRGAMKPGLGGQSERVDIVLGRMPGFVEVEADADDPGPAVLDDHLDELDGAVGAELAVDRRDEVALETRIGPRVVHSL